MNTCRGHSPETTNWNDLTQLHPDLERFREEIERAFVGEPDYYTVMTANTLRAHEVATATKKGGVLITTKMPTPAYVQIPDGLEPYPNIDTDNVTLERIPDAPEIFLSNMRGLDFRNRGPRITSRITDDGLSLQYYDPQGQLENSRFTKHDLAADLALNGTEGTIFVTQRAKESDRSLMHHSKIGVTTIWERNGKNLNLSGIRVSTGLMPDPYQQPYYRSVIDFDSSRLLRRLAGTEGAYDILFNSDGSIVYRNFTYNPGPFPYRPVQVNDGNLWLPNILSYEKKGRSEIILQGTGLIVRREDSNRFGISSVYASRWKEERPLFTFSYPNQGLLALPNELQDLVGLKQGKYDQQRLVTSIDKFSAQIEALAPIVELA